MMYEDQLAGKTAVITGASSGIGKSTSKMLAKAGVNVVLAARSKDKLNDLKSELEDTEGTVHVSCTNVRSPEDVASLSESAADRFDGIDIVVSNAGIVHQGGIPVDDISLSEFERVMETNTYGSFYVSKYTLPYLRKSKGTLIFVGSAAANGPRPNLPIYAATKWWLSGFARSIEAEAGADGVSVSLINPSEVKTSIGADEKLHGDKNEENILLPRDVAEAILFIASRADPASVSGLNLYRQDKLHYLFG